MTIFCEPHVMFTNALDTDDFSAHTGNADLGTIKVSITLVRKISSHRVGKTYQG